MCIAAKRSSRTCRGFSVDLTRELNDRVAAARADGTPLDIRGGGTKKALGNPVGANAAQLDIGGHTGILSYEPAELVLRARAGTQLVEIESALADAGQMFGFEPPHLGPGATLGGCVSVGLSGPRRAFAGSVRDFVLGVTLLTSRGEVLKFGGEVMKNVAGYDVSRLATGAYGTLGVLMDVSLKILPTPRAEITLTRLADVHSAHSSMIALAREPWPVTGSAWCDGRFYVRIAAEQAVVDRVMRGLAAEPCDNSVWSLLRELEHPTLDVPDLWRASVAPSSTEGLDAALAVDWNGGIRYYARPVTSANLMRLKGNSGDPFSHPGNLQMRLHERLKSTFDPFRILNPGRMYAGI